MLLEFETVFARLKLILQKHAGTFLVKPDLPDQYGLYAKIGPATLKVWGGKLKKPMMPVAWVNIGKTYVSYHLMGLYGNTHLLGSLSKKLKARMQGKTCFNFTVIDEALFEELEKLTGQSIVTFREEGYIA